jgi:hypothetical protein
MIAGFTQNKRGYTRLVFGVFELVFFRERDRYRIAETTGSVSVSE